MSDKLAKEAFVSGLSGTSLGEISILTLTLSAGYFMRCVLTVTQNLKTSSTLTSFLFEYTTIVLPGILVFTVLADYAIYILVGLVISSLLVLSFSCGRSGSTSLQRLEDAYNRALSSSYARRLPFITLFRTYITLFTAIAILAVDFTIFPRRLAKAETYGSGLMDIGVGAFMMAHGVTSPESRCQSNKRLSPRSYVKLMLTTFRGILPLLVIGVLRLMMVKGIDYQEHVTEYGVHWNFFFTIAFVRFLCSLLQPLLHSVPWLHLYGVFSLVIAIVYQWCLSGMGLAEYMDKGPHGDGSRPTLFSANREGVISCAGYLAIYLASIEVGQWLFRPRSSLKEYGVVLVKLVALDAILWFLTRLSSVYVEPVSRRFANLTYILWIVSYGVMMLAVFLVIDMALHLQCSILRKPLPSPHPPGPTPTPSPPPQSPSSQSNRQSDSATTKNVRRSKVCFVSAVDFNQLGFFLLANIFTGLVNFLVNTLNTGATLSLIVLILYMACLMIVFLILHKFNIKIKL